MKFLKVFALLSVIILGQSAFASESCKNSKGETLHIGFNWLKGPGTTLKSKAVSAYYKKTGLDASTLETVEDPETLKFDSEETKEGLIFTMMAAVPETEVNSIWNLEVSIKASKAKAVLTDMEGKTFKFTFDCVTGGDLE